MSDNELIVDFCIRAVLFIGFIFGGVCVMDKYVAGLGEVNREENANDQN